MGQGGRARGAGYEQIGSHGGLVAFGVVANDRLWGHMMKRTMRGSVVCVLALLLLAGGSGQAFGGLPALGWPAAGYDLARTSFTPYPGSYGGGTGWSRAVNGAVFGTPAIAGNGTLYFGTGNWYAYAVRPNSYRAKSGAWPVSVKWYTKCTGPVRNTPLVSTDGHVYFSDDNGVIYAFDEYGAREWTFSAGPMRGGLALHPNGYLLAATNSGYLLFIRPTGDLFKSYKIASTSLSTPAVRGADIYMTGADGAIYLATGGWSWVDETDPDFPDEPKGHYEWGGGFLGRRDIGGRLTAPVLDRNGLVYVGGTDRVLRAMKVYYWEPDPMEDPMFQDEAHWVFEDVWKTTLPGAVYAAPAVTPSKLVVVGDAAKRLTAFKGAWNATSARWVFSRVWQVALGGAIRQTPAVTQGDRVYATAGNGRLYRIQAGSIVWSYAAGSSTLSGPAIHRDGTVVVGTGADKVIGRRAPHRSTLAIKASTLSPVKGTVVYLTSTFRYDANLLMQTKRTITLQAWNGYAWTSVKAVASSTGTFKFAVKPLKRTIYRVVYYGSAGLSPAVSPTAIISPR